MTTISYTEVRYQQAGYGETSHLHLKRDAPLSLNKMGLSIGIPSIPMDYHHFPYKMTLGGIQHFQTSRYIHQTSLSLRAAQSGMSDEH